MSARSSYLLVCLAMLSICVPHAAQAQGTLAGIQGKVYDDSGPLPGASVVARDAENGFQYEAVSAADGSFTLAGLRPGTYEITVAMPQFKPQSKTLQLQVGQSITANFKVSPDVLYTEQVQVVGNSRLVETRTSQISTTVTPEEVRYLPQNQRNFLNFAALAPGARVSNDETRKQVTGGGLDATQVNVFIDGVSFKNDVLDGGVVGQDSSRGSPFPQTAVQEFQVLTQNYKAEHEKASSLVITAVTKSGGNRWSGEGSLFYQNKDLVGNEYFAERRGDPKPTYDRFQPGVAIGGPIIRDRLQVFGSYEENRQDRSNRVFLGTTPFPPSLDFLRDYEGTFVSPFRERLFFAKLSTQPRAGQSAEFTYSLRNETDIRSFGGQTSVDSAENVRNRVDSGLARWAVSTSHALNEATITFQRSNWNPAPTNIADVGLNYVNVMRIGGRDTTQDFMQTRTSLRDDYTRFKQWHGSHVIKTGIVFSFLEYQVVKFQIGNPLFELRQDENFAFPFQARYGVGNPDLSTNNRQLGFYVQDDWNVGARLTINAGVRWDYESDMLNNDYVTPSSVRTATAAFVDGNRYFTDGDDRPPFYGAWQPRVGLSYDLTGNGRHVLFGGYGRYVDRVIYNAGLDERFRLQYAVRTFQFSLDGAPRNGQATIVWDPSYQSRAGLDGLIAARRRAGPGGLPDCQRHQAAGVGSIQCRRPHLRPRHPRERQLRGDSRTERFDVPLRQPQSQRHVLPADPRLQQHPGVDDARKNWFDALYLNAERPFDNRWGFRVNYTLGSAEAIGGDLFSLDYRRVEDYPRHPSATDERHRIIVTGIVGVAGWLHRQHVHDPGVGIGLHHRRQLTRIGDRRAAIVALRRSAARDLQLQERGLSHREDLPPAAPAGGIDRVRRLQYLRLDKLRVLQRHNSRGAERQPEFRHAVVHG